MHGISRTTQDTVDRLNGIARGAQNNERDGILLAQTASKRGGADK